MCSGKFRVNANQRRLDVWLVYRCGVCERTWNCTIFERVRPEDISPEDLAGFHGNAEALARRWAFDAAMLRRAGARPEAVEGFEVVGLRGAALPARARIRLSVEVPLGLRLDRVLSAGLDVPRARLKKLVASGAVEIGGVEVGGVEIDIGGGDGERALGRAVRDGQIIRWRREPEASG